MTDPFRQELEAAVGSAYEIERELTGGGMSRVFAATERSLGRRVVIKVLPPDLAAGVNRERFRREIQLSAQLQHPHIVPLLSAGEHGRLLWYTMPYIDGESLRSAVERRGRLPVREVVRIITDVVEALAFAHGRGVIHRDIKPGNVLMQGNHALVTDFGVAKALSAALPSGMGTSTGMAIGTPAYMAPEQLASDPHADHRVDLYAVGLLAYELLTGASPFEGPSPRETMAAQLTRMPPPLESSNPQVPAALSRLVTRCLQKEPERRPQSADDLLRELEAATTGPSPARGPGRRAVRAGLMAVAATAVAGVLILSSRGAPGAGPAQDTTGAADSTLRPGDSAVTVTVPLGLTREDSLEIARAVEAQRPPSSSGQGWSRAQVESLKVQLERAMAESLSRAIGQLQQRQAREFQFQTGERTVRIQTGAGPGVAVEPGPPPRPPVTRYDPALPPEAPRGRPSVLVYPVHVPGADTALFKAIRPARDSLLSVVRRVGTLDVIDLDSLARITGTGGHQVAFLLRNSTQVVGVFEPRPDNTLMLRVDVRPPGWPVRARTVRIESAVVPRDQPMAAVESVAMKLDLLLRRAGEKPQP